jgi:hypothetical protein
VADPSSRPIQSTGGDARKRAEASRGALQRAIASCNGNPLVDVRTGARHADGRPSGLWSRHDLKESTRGLWPLWFYSKLQK